MRKILLTLECQSLACHQGSKLLCRFLVRDEEASICRLFKLKLEEGNDKTVRRCLPCLGADVEPLPLQ